jgi:hypothetical protein
MYDVWDCELYRGSRTLISNQRKSNACLQVEKAVCSLFNGNLIIHWKNVLNPLVSIKPKCM